MSKNSSKVELEIIDLNEIDISPEEKKGNTLNLLWFVLYIVCVISICLVIVTFFVQRTVVEGSSMEPTLSADDSVLVNRLSYLFGSPKRNDLIVFKYDNAKKINYVKRVIGLPGEKIQIKDGYIFINGEQLQDDKFNKEKIAYAGLAEKEITLGDDEYFVLGDNRNASSDSRYSDVGLVHKAQIIGKAYFRVLPFSKLGGVK